MTIAPDKVKQSPPIGMLRIVYAEFCLRYSELHVILEIETKCSADPSAGICGRFCFGILAAIGARIDVLTNMYFRGADLVILWKLESLRSRGGNYIVIRHPVHTSTNFDKFWKVRG
ncbi:hypothetical protein VTL71DRAFT_1248 [Oculimacula yallundae]|uniref:Uncharacterized protein n=1 Tax=Oculimacula yallundae TaxID=86028 RepID=A0ABR4CAC1_9HELO